MLDAKSIQKDFPIYTHNKTLTYLDSAASSLKPKSVIDKVDFYYNFLGVNVHRGVYGLSHEATDMYEDARQTVADFINAEFEEVVFTRGASAALNFVAMAYGMQHIQAGDEIITSELEHHSSVLPWQHVAKIKGAKLIYVPLSAEGRITVEAFASVLTDKTKVVALTHVSNVMGYVTPIRKIIELAHEKNAIVTVDAAQSAPHMAIDVKALDCDFLSFSGHKMLGPTGIGVLYGKKALLNALEPIEFGGDMADQVFLHEATWKDSPYRFETGTPMISGAIGLAAAVKYLKQIGMEAIEKHEQFLKQEAIHRLNQINGVTVYNKTAETGIITFNIDAVHPHDAASVFDQNNVCIRAGHHCAQLVTKFLGVMSTLRASFYIYNTIEDVERFVSSVEEAVQFFGNF